MVDYYEAGLKTGRTSEELLVELEKRYGRSPRQISRYVRAFRAGKGVELPPREVHQLVSKWQVELGTYSPVQLLQVWIDKAHEDAQAHYYTTEDIKRLYTEAQQPHPLRVRPILKVQSDPLFGLIKERFPASGVWVAFDAWCKQSIPYVNAYHKVLKRAESAAAYAIDTFIAKATSTDIRGVDWIDDDDFPGFAKRRRIERLLAVFAICDLLACAIPGRPSSSYWAQLVNDLRGLRLNVNVELSSAIGITPRGGWISGITDVLAESPNLPLEITAAFLDELARLQRRQDKLIKALKKLEDNT